MTRSEIVTLGFLTLAMLVTGIGELIRGNWLLSVLCFGIIVIGWTVILGGQ